MNAAQLIGEIRNYCLSNANAEKMTREERLNYRRAK